jgi:hypothetical protein
MKSINYYKKYIKYKSKYLEIKKQIGGIPFRNIIFSLPDIEDTDMNFYLNPLFGYVFYSNGFIFNYKNFFQDTPVGKIIKEDNFFHQVGNTIKPSNNFLPYITCKEIGIIAGLLYSIYIKKNKECTEEMLVMYPIYKNNRSANDFKKMNKKFFDSFNTEDKEILLDLFRLLLIILWWKINNIDDIHQYFEGVKHSIPSLPLKHDTDETKEFKNLFIKTLTEIELTEMGQAKHFCTNVVYLDSGILISEETYPNCGENVLNNLFNILGYFYKDKFIAKLADLKAKPILIEYYRIFTQENINKKNIFDGKDSDFMAAWSHVVSNLDNIKYGRKGLRDMHEYKFEIISGFSLIPNKLNILEVIGQLIPGVNSWGDFIEKFNEQTIEITPNINELGFGTLGVEVNGKAYDIILKSYHYEIIENKQLEDSDISFNHIKDDRIKNLIDINLNLEPKKNFKYIKWTISNLIEFINDKENSVNLPNIIYDRIINICVIKGTSELILSLEININKMINYTELIKLNFLNLLTDDKLLSNSLSIFTNLKNLILINYNNSLNNSLSTLTILKDLKLTAYNHPLNNSLSTLTNLTNLNLIKYNHPLNNSLSTLTNLTNLNLSFYNHPLDISLSTLINLINLKLNNYNYPLNNSLSTLISLNYLLLNGFNYPLNYSLSTLINLKTLILENYNHQLNDSLSTLTKLEFLRLPEYSQPLYGSLTTLTKLHSLILIKYDNPFNESLNYSLSTLINLKTLNLDKYNYQLNNSLSMLTNLKILKLNKVEYKDKDIFKIISS